MKLQDEWRNPNSLKEDFAAAMRGPQERKPESSAEIEIKDLPIGAEVKIPAKRSSCVKML